VDPQVQPADQLIDQQQQAYNLLLAQQAPPLDREV
jgi:hypothetical protein